MGRGGGCPTSQGGGVRRSIKSQIPRNAGVCWVNPSVCVPACLANAVRGSGTRGGGGAGGGRGNGWSRRRRRQIFTRVELDLCGISERRHARQSGCIGHIVG